MKRIAVIGSGVAGVVSAYYLSQDFEVDLFEATSRLGGHTHTVAVSESDAATVPVDTGFIVFNEKNYPHFMQFLSDLGVAYANSDMSFSSTCEAQNLFWGSDFPAGVFAQKSNLLKPAFYRFLWGVHRFNNRCLNDWDQGTLGGLTLGDYLVLRAIPKAVIENYVLPMTAAIWSASFEEAMSFPMLSFVRFWKNHELLEIGKGLQWKTIPGGSKTYLNKALTHISGQVYTDRPVTGLEIDGNQVRVHIGETSLHYDGVVVATHADTALSLLRHPQDNESKLLGPWTYSTNKTVLHTDASFMPPKRAAWCSWNVRRTKTAGYSSPITLTYWMNRLQPLNTAQNYFVTLNPDRAIAPEKVVKEMVYTHPIMNAAAMATQPSLQTLNQDNNMVFCGSYFGYGFHEDAVASAIQAVASLKSTLRRTL